MEDPSVIGNQAPLVSEDTYNLGAQWRQPLGEQPRISPCAPITRTSAGPGGSRTM